MEPEDENGSALTAAMGHGHNRAKADDKAARALHAFFPDMLTLTPSVAKRPIHFRPLQSTVPSAPSCRCAKCCLCVRRDGCCNLADAAAKGAWCRACRLNVRNMCARKYCHIDAANCRGPHCDCNGPCRCRLQPNCPFKTNRANRKRKSSER